MFTNDQYELLDFGGGRRLERFGPWIMDRPCPAAETYRIEEPSLWKMAHARFDRTEKDQGAWTTNDGVAPRWPISHEAFTLELKRTDFGHVGVFPEQATNWNWIAGRVKSAERPLRVLNLFAYTGGSTLAAATVGAEVTHVDSARNTVQWARANAELSDLADAPIRWIAEDSLRYVKREVKRGRRYDAVILDPPSYGHGTRGEVWRLSKHLPVLLEGCAELLAPPENEPPTPGRFVLLTCHTPKFDGPVLSEMLSAILPAGRMHDTRLSLVTRTARHLPSGIAIRWQGE